MFKVLYCTKDAYVQSRVVNGMLMTGSNVGLAGSLDLFKLYGYTSTQVGTSSVPNVELSRLLVQFDLNPLRELVEQGMVDPGNASFNVSLVLHDVYGGQPCPNNFNVIVYPLSASFDEGHGRDVVFYSDFDVCNFQSSSLASGSWVSPGANTPGYFPQVCDYFTGSGNLTFGQQQYFPKGTEDLCIDVTQIVSATLAGMLPDAGFRISFTSAIENDTHSYFVKRFGSRQAYNNAKRPQMLVRFDDSIQDDTQNFYLDSESYLFLWNYVRGAMLGNLLSGSTQVTGSNSLYLWLQGQFPQAALQVVSSSTCLAPQGPFSIGPEPSDILLDPNGEVTYSFNSGSIVNATEGSFYFAPIFSGGDLIGSQVTFTGFYSGTLNGNVGFASVQGLIGLVSGTYVSPVAGVMSGVFYYRTAPPNQGNGWDITTPILTGSAILSGTLEGFEQSDIWVLTGTFAPAAITSPEETPYLYSGTFVMSSTYATLQVTDIDATGVLYSGSYVTLEPFVPSGTFYLPDGATPAISGTALISGTIGGYTALFAVTGTFVPLDPALFSASYITSQTLGPAQYVAGPFLASQLLLGTNPQTGIYSASVFLKSDDPNLQPQWQVSGSVPLVPVWGSLDGTVAYLTGSLIQAYPPVRGPNAQNYKHLNISVINLTDEYPPDDQEVLRVNIWDYTQPYLINAIRLPVELPGIIIRDVHYQIRDNDTGDIAVPFDLEFNSTRLSNDLQNMYFTLDTSNLTVNHAYVIDILVVTDNVKHLYRGASAVFRVVAWE